MDPWATIPLPAVLEYFPVRGLLRFVGQGLGISTGFRWVDGLVLAGSAALVLFSFVVFVAPIIYQWHLDRTARERKDGHGGMPDCRAGRDFLRRAALSLLVLAMAGAGLWLGFVRDPAARFHA